MAERINRIPTLFESLGITEASYLPRSPYAGMTEEEANLLEAQRTTKRLSTAAEALGIADVQGTGEQGFLEGALDVLTLPQRTVLGALSGRGTPTSGADIIGQAPEDATALERAARFATGFGIDVLTDPLTYLTLGRGGVLRGYKGARVAETDVQRAAREVLRPRTPDLEPEIPVGVGTSAEASMQKASRIGSLLRGDITPLGSRTPITIGRTGMSPQEAVSTAPRVQPSPAPRIQAPEPIAPGTVLTEAPAPAPVTAPRSAFDDAFFTRIGEAAGWGMMFRGGRGVREGIENTLKEVISDPDELRRTTNAILNRTRSEVRGGIGIRIPFIGLDEAGNIVPAGKAVTRRIADLTPGSGRALDEAGLRGVAEATRSIFNNYRSGSFYRRWSSLMNGRFGAEYADVIRNAVKVDPASAGSPLNYTNLKKLVESYDKRTVQILHDGSDAAKVLQAVKNMIEQSPDYAESAKAFEDYFDAGAKMALKAGANDVELTGFEAASALRNHGEALFDEVIEAGKRAGIPISRADVENFVPRVLSSEEIAFRKARGEKGRIGVYDPTKPSKMGFDTDEIGRLERVSNKELNRRYVEEMRDAQGNPIRPKGHRHFETDPLKIATQQYAAYTRLIRDLNVIADLKETGLLVRSMGENVQLLNLPKLVKRGERFQTELEIIADRLANAAQTAIASGNTAQAERISNAVTKIVTDNNALTQILAGIQDTRPENLKIIGDITAVMRSALATGEDVGIKLTKAQKERLFGGAKELIRVRSVITNADELTGLSLIGGSADTRIPAGLTNMYAHYTVKDAVEKMFKIESGNDSAIAPFVNNIYQPLYTLIKTYMTVGRPGGYHMRNVQGGALNNYLGDVSAADHKLSGDILVIAKQSKNQASDAINKIFNGKASGLNDQENKIAEYIVDLARKRGGTPSEYEAEQLADIILYNKLRTIKIGSTNAAEVLAAARNNDVFRQNRKMEYLRDQAMASGTELADAISDPNFINLFPNTPRSELGKIQNAMNSAANLSYIRRSGELSDVSENWLRLAAFISGARRFGVEDNGIAASLLTKAIHFDYTDLSDFERRIMKNIMPFYVWTRQNLPLQFFALMNQPGKFNRLANAQENLQTQFGAYTDEEGMSELVPSWMRERMGFVSRYTFNGNPILLGIESPALDLNRYLTFAVSGEGASRIMDEVISNSNPFLKAGIEGVTQVDLFGRRPFSENGVPSPFGDLPVPGSWVNADGERVVDEYTYSTVKDLIPPLGLAARLSGVGGEGDRLLSNWLSTVGGAPVGTLTPRQAAGELRGREDRLRSKIKDTARALGVDTEWLSERIASGASAESIRYDMAQGFGRL